MTLTPQDLQDAAQRTVEHYNRRAEDFRDGTRGHDVTQNIAVLLQYIEGCRPLRSSISAAGRAAILRHSRSWGMPPPGWKARAQFAARARWQGFEIWEQNFLALDLPAQRFDGVFANASPFHVPSQELTRVLRELNATLKPRGVLFISNPRGQNEEDWNGERYLS